MVELSRPVDGFSQPLKLERDLAAVELSNAIAEIRAAKQINAISQEHIQKFKTNFVRLCNLTIADSKIIDVRYLKTEKKLIDIVRNVINEDCKLKNIVKHCEVAEIYLTALFSNGILNI